MKHILSPGQVWHGPPVRSILTANQRPVALPDTLDLSQDSGPAPIVVLANDFDPEGAQLTVVSATAIWGDVQIETDGSITYTPPSGFTGTDTVTYVVEDDQGSSNSADVTINVSAPQLSVEGTPENTLKVLAELGQIDVTITTPANFAGTHQFNTSDLAAGPVNLVAPAISGVAALGETLTATEGLWSFDTDAGDPSRAWQWTRNGGDISGATGPAYTLIAADVGQGIAAVESLTDAYGARSVASAPVGSAFAPSDDVLLSGWWDASDVATITHSGGSVSGWTDKAGGNALIQNFSPQRPETGVRTLNSLNVLDFDGGRLLQSNRTLPVSGDVAFHMVLEIDSTANLYEAVLSVEATNDFQVDAGSSTQFDGRLNPAGIGSLTPLSGGPFSGAMILSAVFDQTGTGQAEIYIGNSLRGSMAYTAPIDSGAALHIMTNRSKNAWVNGAVAEVIVTGDVTNRADYHTYFQTKWGIV